MPKIYVLLSKGFVVNDGRLAGVVALGRFPMPFQATYVVCRAFKSLFCFIFIFCFSLLFLVWES